MPTHSLAHHHLPLTHMKRSSVAQSPCGGKSNQGVEKKNFEWKREEEENKDVEGNDEQERGGDVKEDYEGNGTRKGARSGDWLIKWRKKMRGEMHQLRPPCRMKWKVRKGGDSIIWSCQVIHHCRN